MASDFINKNRRQVHGGPVTLTNIDSSATNQWFGTTLITSRYVAVSAPAIAATSPVRLSTEWLGLGSYGVAVDFQVMSKAAGVGFYLGTVNSVGFSAAGAASCQVHWEILNPTA
jgi:hypothetical protein